MEVTDVSEQMFFLNVARGIKYLIICINRVCKDCTRRTTAVAYRIDDV